jgi:hypothetical protein
MPSWSFVEIDPQRTRVHASYADALRELTSHHPGAIADLHELLAKWP